MTNKKMALISSPLFVVVLFIVVSVGRAEVGISWRSDSKYQNVDFKDNWNVVLKEGDWQGGDRDVTISLPKQKEYLEININNKTTIRVYPCGKVDVLEYKEIVPNKEASGIIRMPSAWGNINLLTR